MRVRIKKLPIGFVNIFNQRFKDVKKIDRNKQTNEKWIQTSEKFWT